MNNQQIPHNKLVHYLIGGGASVMLIGFFLLPWATRPPFGGKTATGLQVMMGALFPNPILEQLRQGKSIPGPWLLAIPVVSVLALLSLFVLSRLHKWHRAYWLMLFVAALVGVYPLFRLFIAESFWITLGNEAFIYYPRSSSNIGFFATLIGILCLTVGAIGGMLGKKELNSEVESTPAGIGQKI